MKKKISCASFSIVHLGASSFIGVRDSAITEHHTHFVLVWSK